MSKSDLKDPITRSLNLRLEDGYNNIFRKLPDPHAICNDIFVLRQTHGNFKPNLKRKKSLKITPLSKINLSPLELYNQNNASL